MPWWEPAIAGLQAVTPGISGMITNKSNQRFANDQATKAFSRNVDMWNWQNEYNTPQHQMQRLQAAGINKLLPFIGGGSASGGSSAPMASAQAATSKSIAPTLGGGIETLYDLKLKKAGTDKLIEETAGLKTANERALVTWMVDKGYISETKAAEAAQKMAESGLKDIELNREKGKDMFYEKNTKDFYGEGGKDLTAGYKMAENKREIETKGNALIDANADNIRIANIAKKRLVELLDSAPGGTGWETIKTAILLILNKS